MNPLNIASLAASQRLHAKGIMLETEKNWYILDGKAQEYSWLRTEETIIPRPSMAEVWRELPDGTEIFKQGNDNIGWYSNGRTIDANPTDALIDLLIWTVEQGKEKV
jgi:hypothetical protein